MPSLVQVKGQRKGWEMSFLLILLAAVFAGTVNCKDYSSFSKDLEDGSSWDVLEDSSLLSNGSVDLEAETPNEYIEKDLNSLGRSDSDAPGDSLTPPPNGLHPLFSSSNIYLAIAIPLVLLLMLLAVVIGVMIKRRKRNPMTLAYMKDFDQLHGVDTDTVKIESPLFDDDIPSVLELDMEDLEKWMDTPKKPSDCVGVAAETDGLPSVKEETDSKLSESES
ncbi:transmembrane protein 154-like isoform X1 [Acipenser ruthenus]|uniref:transmembrane protein 154-like isoform X1 n=1 Tax=Acipenser ruthenus TaxID=7906 RepID=UPI00145A2846|nr:transmembrane protein 154-like isoform X1 [Acipenser ruthenus]